jgi:hypothetical protein
VGPLATRAWRRCCGFPRQKRGAVTGCPACAGSVRLAALPVGAGARDELGGVLCGRGTEQFALVMPPSLSRVRRARPVPRAPVWHDIATPRGVHFACRAVTQPGGVVTALPSLGAAREARPGPPPRAALAAMLTAWPSRGGWCIRRRRRCLAGDHQGGGVAVRPMGRFRDGRAGRCPGSRPARAMTVRRSADSPAIHDLSLIRRSRRRTRGPVVSGQQRRVTWSWAARSGQRPGPCRARRRVAPRASAPGRDRRGGHRAGGGGLR